MGINNRAIRRVNGRVEHQERQRRNERREKSASGCTHKAGKRRDGNVMRCVGCDKIVGLWRVADVRMETAARRKDRGPQPQPPVSFDMADSSNPLAAVQFALERLFRGELAPILTNTGGRRKADERTTRREMLSPGAQSVNFDPLEWWS
jgi:hypothetical protein